MAQLTRIQVLATLDQERVEAILARFRAAWNEKQPGQPLPKIEDFLPPPDDPLRLHILHALIPFDIDLCWQRGQNVLVESYLKSFPELSTVNDLPVSIYFAEYLARHRSGNPPTLAEYKERCSEEQYKELMALYRDAPSMVWTLDEKPPEIKAKRGAFVVEAQLGSGSFGRVVRARDHNDRLVAIKIIDLKKTGALNELTAFENIKNLGHPFVVRMEDVLLDGQELRIVMELVEGDLEGRAKACLKAGLDGIPTDELLPYFRCAAKALDDYRAAGILHLDVKPQNIMLHRGCAKLADFGLSRLKSSDQSSAMLSVAGGTPFYMAPEVGQGRAHDNSDQFSLALSYVILREFKHFSESQDILVLNSKWRQGDFTGSNLSEAEKLVLKKALDPDPQNRFASCVEFVSRLEEVFAPLPSPGRQKRFWITVAVLGTACAAAIVLAVLASLRPAPRIALHTPPTSFVAAGKALDLPIEIDRARYAGPITLSFADAAVDSPVLIDSQVVEPGQQEVKLHVAAPVGCRPGVHTIAIKAQGDKVSTEATMNLGVVFLPDGFEGQGSLVSTSKEHSFFPRIVKHAGDQEVPFLLIPGGNGVANFYMMENKVWNALFRAFKASQPKKDRSETFLVAPGKEMFPVFEVGVNDAYACAVWLKGRLPSAKQWDRAAGVGTRDAEHPEGPYRGKWSPKPPLLDIAVQGLLKPVGASKDDVSHFGVRDMSGNGAEWTRNLLESTKLVPLEHPDEWQDSILLRGNNFNQPAPLRFIDITEKVRSLPYREKQPYVGFRVVVEPEKSLNE